MRLLSLALSVGLFWFAFSGRTEPLYAGAMIASAAVVVALSVRMRIVDAEGHPIGLLPRLPGFLLWLCGQVVRSNLAVAARVLAPRPCVAPRLLRVPARQGRDLGRAVLANCVTLTPGTVTLEVQDEELLVHALAPDAGTKGRIAELDRRVRALCRGERGGERGGRERGSQ